MPKIKKVTRKDLMKGICGPDSCSICTPGCCGPCSLDPPGGPCGPCSPQPLGRVRKKPPKGKKGWIGIWV